MLLGLGIPLTYLIVMGGLMPVFNRHIRSHCHRCQHPESYYSRCYDDHGSVAFFQALFWFIGLPAYLSSKHLDGPSRAEKRRAKELAEAKHNAEMAALQAQRVEDLEIANGIVPSYPAAVKAARRRLGEDYEFGKD